MVLRFPSVVLFPSILVVFAAAISPLWPFSIVEGGGFHDNQRIIEISCLVLTALFGATLLIRSGREDLRQIFDRRIIFFLFWFFLLGLASSVFAYSPRHALFEWAGFLLLLTMSALIASEIRAKGQAWLDKILLFCGLGAAVYIVIEAVVYIVAINAGGQPSNSFLIYGFDNYRFLNHVQTVTLPLLGLLICRSGNGKQKIFAWGVASSWWALLFVPAGRGTLLGLAAGVCAAWFCLRSDAKPWCRVMLWSGLAGLGIYVLFYVLIPLSLGLHPFGFLSSVIERTIENPDSSRWSLWVRAWQITLAHPWLGAGPLHFAHFGRDVQLGAHPHNWMLQIACEWGIPALLALAAAIVLGFKKLLAARQYLLPTDVRNHLTLAAWLTTGVAILVDGLVSGLIVMPTSQLWIAVYIGCCWGWVASITPAQRDSTLRLSMAVRFSGLAGLVMLIYFLGNGMWPEIRNLSLHEEQNLQKERYAHPVPRPRIWRAGYF